MEPTQHHQRATTATRGSKSELVRMAERNVTSPLASLRVLLESIRSGDRPAPGPAFVDRALDEIERVERAAADLLAWTSPRPLRAVHCSADELIESVRATMEPELAERCEFVLEDGSATLEIDARTATETLIRILRHAASSSDDEASRVMLHGHSDDEWITISVVDAPGAGDRSGQGSQRSPNDGTTLAEALMTRDAHRLGGRASMHRTGEHRCYVIVLPRAAHESKRGVA